MKKKSKAKKQEMEVTVNNVMKSLKKIDKTFEKQMKDIDKKMNKLLKGG